MATGSVTADGRARVLADGTALPMPGLGAWQIPNGAECVSAVRWALGLGYRHIGTAQAYGNAESVGWALERGHTRSIGVSNVNVVEPDALDTTRGANRALERPWW